MAFKFSLEQVLKYRSQLEQEAKIQFAQMENERMREERRLEAIIQSLEKEQYRLANLKADEIEQRWVIENFIKGLRHDLVESQKYLQVWTKKAEQAREVLTEKARDKKMLEKLKEKQGQRYVEDEKHKEQKFFDEIIASKHIRKSGEDEELLS